MKLFVNIDVIGFEVDHSKAMSLIKDALKPSSIRFGYFDPSKQNNEYQLNISSFDIYDDDEDDFYTTVQLSLSKQGFFREMEIEISQKAKASEKIFFILFKELLEVLTKSEAINKIA